MLEIGERSIPCVGFALVLLDNPIMLGKMIRNAQGKEIGSKALKGNHRRVLKSEGKALMVDKEELKGNEKALNDNEKASKRNEEAY